MQNFRETVTIITECIDFTIKTEKIKSFEERTLGTIEVEFIDGKKYTFKDVERVEY